MSDGTDDLGDYVRKVQQNTQEYLRGLINENEKLCALIHTLEGELDRERKDRLRIEERIATIDAERRAYLTKYEEVEAQNTNVSNLYVATLRVHGSIGRSDVLGAIHEIIINLIGCEELAVLEVNHTGSTLVLSSSFGIEPVRYQRIELGDGIIGDCAATSRMYIAGDEWDGARSALDDNLTACIPLIVEGVVTGAIAIFRLLDHKPKLEPIDHELFALLGTHAAMALHYTTLVERLGGRRSLPPTRMM